MFLSKLSVERPWTVTMLVLIFVVFGALSYNKLQLNTVPDTKIPMVVVNTRYDGAGPSEIEILVTKLVEDAVSTISEIDQITSYSNDNSSMVMVRFKATKNVDIASQEIKDNVDAIINNLPDDAQKPTVRKFDVNAEPVIRLVLSGPQSSLELYEYADLRLRDRFAQIPGVAQVDVSGGQEREIQVVFDDRTVYSNNLNLVQLSSILASKNYSLPSGNFSSATQDISVKLQGELKDIANLRNLEVPTPVGIRKLSQIADVQDTGTVLTRRTTFFDVKKDIKHENVVSIDLTKSSDGNAVEISRDLKRRWRGIVASLPKGMELTIINDGSVFVESAVNDTLSNVFLGVLFCSLILLLFLHDIRSTLIVAITMPICIVSTFMLMRASGFTLNIMSLLGLSTAVGILVTNSIIVLENIFRYKRMGYSSKEAADLGTSEITVAVLAATFTNLVVFIPIAIMAGTAGQMLREFAFTVTFATLFSLLNAFTMTPMFASIILKEEHKPNRLSQAIENTISAVENGYAKLLGFVLGKKSRSAVILILSVILLVFSLYVATNIGFDFMPNLNEGTINMTVELPIGTNIGETARILHDIENIIAKNPEVLYIRTNLGSGGRTNTSQNQARSTIELVPNEERELTTDQVLDKLIKQLSGVSNAKIILNPQFTSIPGFGGGGGRINLNVTGIDELVLAHLAEEIIEKIKDIPGLINLDTSSRAGRPQLTITPKREQMVMTGNNVYDVAVALRTAISGRVSTYYREGGNEYDIRIMMNEDTYNTPEKLKNLVIVTSAGRFHLGQLADIEFTEGVNRIVRFNKSKTITITGSPATGIPLGDITSEMERRIKGIEIPDGYGLRWTGGAQMMKETTNEMARAGVLAIILLYMLLTAILESSRQPFLILTTIPLAMIGAFLLQYSTGLSMNLFSMMALIMLAGIVVTNAILILDYANKLIGEGKSVREALLEACPIKLKPVVMTNIAIMLGMLPMALGIGSAGKEFRQSMGIVSIGGLVMSMLLTLVVIPALYYVMTREK
jgi:HAE1 family hydrophobic/amphiphilic exporter-1